MKRLQSSVKPLRLKSTTSKTHVDTDATRKAPRRAVGRPRQYEQRATRINAPTLRHWASVLLTGTEPERAEIAAGLIARASALAEPLERGRKRKLYAVTGEARSVALVPIDEAAELFGTTVQSLRVLMSRNGGTYRKPRIGADGNPYDLVVSVSNPTRSERAE